MSKTFVGVLVLIVVILGSDGVLGQDNLYRPWEAWGSCSQTCGGGYRWRYRDCVDWDNWDCWDLWQSSDCNTQSCNGGPVHGQWSQWSTWRSCSVTCGGGSQSRSRTCTNPPPSNGGQNCVGSSTQTQSCSTPACPPRHGQWSSWSSWGRCSVTCGGGSQSRTRTCTNPAPANGGRNCQGSGTETQACATQNCGQGCRPGANVTDRCGQRCVCSSSGTLTQCTRIRREFTSMTAAERTRYIQIVKTASTDTRYKSRYDALITLHRTNFNNGIHNTPVFLPWHRWFILQYENLLREVDCRFTVAYWDWSVVAGNPWGTTASDLWYSGDSGFGGNGQGTNNCVQTGPFREAIWRLVPSASQRCLQRRFNGVPSSAVDVESLLRTDPGSFLNFWRLLEQDLHNSVHCLIEGTMCTIDSASAPEFFLHHGMIDKIWEDWQKKSQRHRTAHFPAITVGMPVTGGALPGAFIDNLALPGGVRAEWAPITNREIQSVETRLRTMSLPSLQKIPRVQATPLSQRAIKLFGMSKKDVREVQRLQSLIRSHVKTLLPSGKSPIDKKLGFNHNFVVKTKTAIKKIKEIIGLRK